MFVHGGWLSLFRRPPLQDVLKCIGAIWANFFWPLRKFGPQQIKAFSIGAQEVFLAQDSPLH
jgi:hypothetical protein